MVLTQVQLRSQGCLSLQRLYEASNSDWWSKSKSQDESRKLIKFSIPKLSTEGVHCTYEVTQHHSDLVQLGGRRVTGKPLWGPQPKEREAPGLPVNSHISVREELPPFCRGGK